MKRCRPCLLNRAIVNPSLARQLGIAGNPVGHRFLAGESSPVVYEIVGFVPDMAYSDVGEELRLIVFVPMAQITDPRPFTDLKPENAACRALSAGGAAQALVALRDQRGLPWLDDLGRDLRYGLRTLVRSQGFTATALLSLALGIGANAGIFSLLDQILLRPLPVREPERLVQVDWPPRRCPRCARRGSIRTRP
jgi:hypothetical protein